MIKYSFQANGVTRLFVVFLAIACAGLGLGCKVSETPVYTKIFRPSDAGLRSLAQGQAAYQNLILSGDEACATKFQERMAEEVIPFLRRAVTNDDSNPLFQVMLANGLMDIGNVKEAEFHLKRAAQIEEDFVPIWLTQAELEIRRGNVEGARKALDSARGAYDSFKRIYDDVKFYQNLSISLLGIELVGPAVKEIDDPTNSNAERVGYMLSFFAAERLFYPENGGYDATQKKAEVAALLKHLQAREKFMRLLINEKAGMPAKKLEIRLREDVLDELDPNNFQARLLLARTRVELGEFVRADDLLGPYTEMNAVLAVHPELWVRRAEVFRAWVEAGSTGENPDKLVMLGEECLIRAWSWKAPNDRDYPPANMEAIRLYLAAMEKNVQPDRKDEMKTEVRAFFKRVKDSPCTDKAEVQRLEARFEKL